ncbi:hypothetical protein PFBG_05172 [Plasmodium falciparum 7G8]|uniref:Uncharacterized protein n=1 Tax=Plasmodium falciparum (isolate 7G8) TaxID=57266 RepID=W7F891_PLAF8|nr:hypothetical protein PFBG_05172 [Plasmodium falciparum 7G8]
MGKWSNQINGRGNWSFTKYIYDNLYNFQWINRENNEIEDNLILTKSISLERVEQYIYFKDIFKGEYFSKLLEIPEALEELKIHMPEGYKTKEDIIDVINSRALNPNLKALDMSLPTHLNFVLISLNLPPHEGEVNDPMEYIVDALEKKYTKEENN